MICFYLQKKRKRKQYSKDDGHFLRTEIDSTGFTNETLTTKNIFQNILKKTKQSNKTSTSKDIGQRNKSNKIAKNCWLSRCKIKKKIKKKIICLYLREVRRKNNKKNNSSVRKKNIGQINKSNKIAKNCWFSRYKSPTSNKMNYLFVRPKNKTKKQ